jgi:D-alanyl-D-alanine carboxypeptidase
MIFQLLTQAMLTLSVLQMYPADAGVVENNTMAAEARDVYGVNYMDALSVKPVSAAVPSVSDLAPAKVQPTSVGVKTSAVSALVVDRQTGKVLYQKNAATPRSIGSITKLMTAYVFLQDNPDLDATAQILPEDVRYGGIQHVNIADKVTVRDLLHASLVGSDNSATAALVRLSGMSLGDFVARMNETAAEVGMKNTTFVDSTGLSADNRSTVNDIVKLLDATLQNETVKRTTQLDTISFEGESGRVYNIGSTNDLLTGFLNEDPYEVVGGKTGFLPEAGYCFGGVFSEDDAHEISVVVLGSKTEPGRFQDAKALASWAYKVYDWPDEQEI